MLELAVICKRDVQNISAVKTVVPARLEKWSHSFEPCQSSERHAVIKRQRRIDGEALHWVWVGFASVLILANPIEHSSVWQTGT